MPEYFFLHPASGRSWPTDDPHTWLLDHRDHDLLAPARDRLVASPDDAARCLKVALRRCGLVLLQVVSPSQVVVRYWTEPVSALKPWAKEHRLAKLGVAMTLVNEKTGQVVVHQDAADVLLGGERVGGGFPWALYAARYGQRKVEEPDDQDAAPAAYTHFGWPGVPPETLTWALLKSIWNAERIECPNCDLPLVTTGCSWNRTLLSFRPARLVRHCVLGCRRRFEADEDRPLEWLANVLEPHLRPAHLLWWRTFEIEWSDSGPCLR